MGEAEFVSDSGLLWDEEESWAFPILATSKENGGNSLIDSPNLSNEEEAPPPPAVKVKKRGGDGDSDEHELHIWTERERRKKMRNMFTNLHELIPQLHPRADKSTIVDEAIVYIQSLERKVEILEAKKESLKGGDGMLQQTSREAFMAELASTGGTAVTLENSNIPVIFKTWTSPNLTVNVCGKDAHISICCPNKLGFLTAIFFVMDRYNFQVVSAQVSTDRGTRMYIIHARINGGPNQFSEALFPVEEIFKQAAAEILLWLNS